MQNLQKSIRKTKKKAKITYYSKLLHKYKTDSNRTWQVMKEIIGKQKTKSNLIPQEIKADRTIINFNLYEMLQALLKKANIHLEFL